MTKSLISGLMGWIVTLGALALIYGAGNALLVGGQKLWHRGEQQRLDELTLILEHERQEISKLETQLQDLVQKFEGESRTLDQARAKIDALEARYPSGIPKSLYDDYRASISAFNTAVEEHNARRAEYEPVFSNYSRKMDEYNALVDGANKLSKAIGSTWYIVPMPPGSRARPSAPK